MSRHNGISGGDWRRDAVFIVISIAVIMATIIILIKSGLAKARYEPPKYPFYLVISELIYLAQLSLVGLRLSIIFDRGMGYRVGTGELIKIAAAQTFTSLLVPGFYIGGEAVSIAYLTFKGLPTTRATEGIVLRYTVDTITLTSIVLVLYLLSLVAVPYIALIMALILLLAYVVLFIAIVSARLGRYIEKVFRFISSKISIASNFILINEGEVYGIKLTVIDYLALFLASIIQWVLSGLNVVMIFYALGIHISLVSGILISSSYIILTYISVLPGSAGIGELANLYILNSLGLGSYYLAYDVWFRVITYVVPLIILMPAFLSISRKLAMIGTNHRSPQ
ncbi:lysylphosphatidylglycerol synthase transmembrane domain-containing protein [Vulcanisaeta sp. JCM 14467]|uniref:lysylphosphatidylglycerol synthase transmembrane domain-containing protein n=1 Tax=Vulcanisaeta sp. JCM 14467 TaxID=1295370 RepID=UPI0006D1B6C3|nr:lysylphosphatidylglycerol synthase transmembrane domain-containing protein [Vulcanisaeta sp. JCM 14467]